MKVEFNKKGIRHVWFDSLTQLKAYEVPRVNQPRWARVMRGEGGNSLRWLGVSSVSEVLNIVNNGWPAGLQQFKKYFDKVSLPMVKSVRRRKARGDFGDHLDMQRVYAGDLNRAWEKTERRDSGQLRGNRVTVLTNSAAAASQNATELFWNGVATALICEALQASGRDYELVYSHTGYNCMEEEQRTRGHLHPVLSCFAVKLKSFGEPLSLERIASTVVLPGFFRVYGFKMIMSTEDEAADNLGYPRDAEIPHQVLHNSERVIVVPRTFSETALTKLIPKIPEIVLGGGTKK